MTRKQHPHNQHVDHHIDDADPVLDAFLAEALGGETAPDLSDKILRALASGQDAARQSTAASLAPPAGVAQGPIPAVSSTAENAPSEFAAIDGRLMPVPVKASRHNGETSASTPSAKSSTSVPVTAREGSASRRRLRKPRRTAGRFSAVIAASLVAVAAGWWLSQSGDDGGSLARHPSQHSSSDKSVPAGPTTTASRERDSQPASPTPTVSGDANRAEPGNAHAGGSPSEGSPSTSPQEHVAQTTPAPGNAADQDSIDEAIQAAVGGTAADPPGETVLTAPQSRGQDSQFVGRLESDERETIALVDERIAFAWADAGVSPAPPATDGEWVRRIYLDVLGRIPTVEESLAYVGDHAPNKRERLAERLLYAEDYTEEFARNWSTQWTNALIGRTGGTGESLANRAGLQQYLRRAFLENRPFDDVVYDLLTATGTSQPGAEGYNPAVNFLLNEIQLDLPQREQTTRATAKVSRIFLGVQLQCTQCHSHPFNDLSQQRFWTFDAFFRQMQTEQLPGDGGVKLVDRDFAGESGDIASADIFFEMRNGLLRVAYPEFLDGTPIERDGRVSVVNRRQKLAEFVINSPRFRQAMVDRAWEHFLGHSFTGPGYSSPPSHPEILTSLGNAFAANNYDMRQLMKWIVLSKPYSLSSRITPGNEDDAPELGQPPLYARFYLRQMEAEELFESLLVATAAHKSADREAQQKVKQEWLSQIVTTLDTDEGGETTTFNGTIPQALMMMNSEFINRAISAESGTLLSDVVRSDMQDRQKIQYLFLAGLSRQPTKDQIQVANALWQRRDGNTTEALKDIWWAILNSNEFILNH